jgi:hypothetical protein
MTTKNNKHTPGPWKLGNAFGIKDKNGNWVSEPIRSVFANDETNDTGPSSICTAHESDAKLIAAAPEMLEALEFILMASDFDGQPIPIVSARLITEKAKDAIRKARGES